MGLKLSLLLRVYCLVLTGALAGAVSAADLQVEHVTIISAERTSPVLDVLVRVHDGRIVAVSKAGSTTAPTGRDAILIDGTGLYLAPGLIDWHRSPEGQ